MLMSFMKGYLFLFNYKEPHLGHLCMFGLDLPAVGEGEREKRKKSTALVPGAAGSALWKALLCLSQSEFLTIVPIIIMHKVCGLRVGSGLGLGSLLVHIFVGCVARIVFHNESAGCGNCKMLTCTSQLLEMCCRKLDNLESNHISSCVQR